MFSSRFLRKYYIASDSGMEMGRRTFRRGGSQNNLAYAIATLAAIEGRILHDTHGLNRSTDEIVYLS